MFCLGYRMDESGRNRQGDPVSPHPRQSRGTEVQISLWDEGNRGMRKETSSSSLHKKLEYVVLSEGLSCLWGPASPNMGISDP